MANQSVAKVDDAGNVSRKTSTHSTPVAKAAPRVGDSLRGIAVAINEAAAPATESRTSAATKSDRKPTDSLVASQSSDPNVDMEQCVSAGDTKVIDQHLAKVSIRMEEHLAAISRNILAISEAQLTPTHLTAMLQSQSQLTPAERP